LLQDEELLTNWKIIPDIRLTGKQKNRVLSLTGKLMGKKMVAVAPGSIWKTKRYPKEYFLKIIEYFCNNVMALFGRGKRRAANMRFIVDK